MISSYINQIAIAIFIVVIAALWIFLPAAKRFRANFTQLFDKTISGGIGKQLTIYVCIVTSILVLFIVIALLLDSHSICGSEDNIWDKIRGVIQHFIDPGNLMEETGNIAVQIFTFLVTIIGMVLFSGLLLSTLVNAIDSRKDDIEYGRVVYNHLKNHYAIIGFGEISSSIINDIFLSHFWEQVKDSKKNEWTSREAAYKGLKEMSDVEAQKWSKYLPTIVIFTSQNIPDIRRRLFAYFSSNITGNIIFYSGDIESEEQLSNLSFCTTKEVYILGEMSGFGRDTKNLEAVSKICRLRGESKEMMTVHVQFDKLTSYSIIQRLNLPKSYTHYHDKPTIFMRPFNFYENTARQLWGFTGGVPLYERLDFEPVVEDKYVHLVIVGFNRMGRALLFEALRLCHFPNYVESDSSNGIEPKNKSVITVVDKNMDQILASFKAEFPYLNQIKDIEVRYWNNRVEDERVREMLAREAEADNALLTVAISLQDSDYSLSAGLSLPHQLYYKIENGAPISANSRILIRQELQKGMQEVLELDQKRFANVHTFGMLTTGVTQDILNDDIAMCVGAYYDSKWWEYEKNEDKKAILANYVAYIKEYGGENDCDNTFIDWLLKEEHRDGIMEFARRLWIYTSEDFRFANRYQVDAYITYIIYRDAGDKLAQMEHMRWNADRSIIGYRDTSKEGVKNADFQLHKLIIPFHALDVGAQRKMEIEKDEDVIENMNKLFTLFKVDKEALYRKFCG